MGAAVGPQKGGAKSDINVTPLIDIVLVLLIVFIVMVPGLSHAHKAAIPQTTVVNQPQPAKNDAVVVTVDKDGKYYLQQDEIQLAELAEKLVDPVMRQVPMERKVILKVEEDIPFQYAVSAMDQIRRASDIARKKTAETNQLQDGGDVKVAISMKKKS